MDRDLKFRGLRKDGAGWIYGFFYKIRDKSYILNEKLSLEGFVMLDVIIEVIPETVGQLIGETKDGNILFEHDIIMNGESIRFIEFRWSNFVATTPSKTETILLSFIKNAKAIGNIHENPNLLK